MEFKIGDYVKVIGDRSCYLDLVGPVVDVSKSGVIFVRLCVDGDNYVCHIMDYELRLLSKDEILYEI